MRFFSFFNFNRKILFAVILFIIIITIIEIWVVNRLSTFGAQILALEKSQESLKLENKILENQIAEKAALIKVKEESKKMGFDSIQKIEYIK